MKKRIFALLLAFDMCFSLLVGCGDNSGDKTPEDTGPIPVVYWGTWGAANAEYINKVIADFNASQDKYVVSFEYVGAYADLLAKIQVTNPEHLPAMVNGSNAQHGTWMYADFVVPISEFASADDPAITKLYANQISAWGDTEGSLVGYPMGNTMMGIYFNMDMMDAIGVNPYTDVTCLEDLYDICKKVVDSGVAEYGIGTDHSNIYLNCAMSIQGVDCVDHDNGKSGPCSVSYYDQAGTREYVARYLQLWRNISNDGLCYPLGSNWANDVLPVFAAENLAIVTGTIGGYGKLNKAWTETHDTPCNIAFIPWQAVTDGAANQGSIPAAGNAHYIINTADKRAQEGAWEFIKYFTSSDVYAEWCAVAGYLPISEETYNSQIYRDYIAQHTLDYDYLVDKQIATDSDCYAPITPINNEFQAAGIKALETVVADPNYSIDTAIDEMAKAINSAMDMWHLEND